MEHLTDYPFLTKIPQDWFAVSFRVASAEYVSSDLLVKFISSSNKFKHYILVQEDPDEKVKRVHNHFAGGTEYNTGGTVRANLKKALINLDGNKDYGGLKENRSVGTMIDMYAYTCKGTGSDFDTQGPNVICTDMPEEDIRFYHAKYWANYAPKLVPQGALKVQLEIPDDVPKKKKRTKMFMEKLRDEIVEEFPDKTWNIDDDADFNFLTRKLYKSLGKTVKNLDAMIFNRMMNGLVCGLPKTFDVEEADIDLYRARYRSVR